MALWRIARLEPNAGADAAALSLYEEASSIMGSLSEMPPGFVQWTKEKKDFESELSSDRSDTVCGRRPPRFREPLQPGFLEW